MDEIAVKLLLDERAISRTVIRYATGVDSRNWELYRARPLGMCLRAQRRKVLGTSCVDWTGPGRQTL